MSIEIVMDCNLYKIDITQNKISMNEYNRWFEDIKKDIIQARNIIITSNIDMRIPTHQSLILKMEIIWEDIVDLPKCMHLECSNMKFKHLPKIFLFSVLVKLSFFNTCAAEKRSLLVR